MQGYSAETTHERPRGSVPGWLDRALAHLAGTQRIDGEVPVWVANNCELSGEPVMDSNHFGTAIVLHALREVRDHRARRVCRRAATFLRRGMEPGGIWRFWTPKSGRAVDPDLDVIAVVSAALREHDPRWGQSIRWPERMRRDSRGRFFTWLREPGAPNDIDAVVNANVLWWLGDHDETEGASRFVRAVLRDDDGVDAYPYYENILALCFAAARAWSCGARSLEGARGDIIARIAERQRDDGSLGNVWDTATSLAALKYLGEARREPAQRTRAWLMARQSEDGSWPRGAAWNGPEWPLARSLWWGSEALTTGVIVGGIVP